MSGSWPLTGRAEELQLIAAAMTRRSGTRGVVLAGAAGVGKTRLARETLLSAKRRGATTHWAVASVSAQSMPLGAFASLVGDLGRDPTRVLTRALDVMGDGASRGGVMVGVDDAHLLDELSALLVHQLVLSGRARVVVTTRTGAPSPDAVTALWKDGHLDRVELQPLSQPETGTLLQAVLRGPVDSTGLARLWELTGGNPLYLRQLVDGELEAGRLHQIYGVWRWDGTPQLPAGLVELVDARIGAVSDAVREVVDLLAISEPLSVSLLGDVTDPAAVEQAEASGVVTVESGSLQARLAHPLYGETRRARLGQLRARRLRGQIAAAMGSVDAGLGGAENMLRRAVLAVDSDLEPDPRLLTAASQEAAQLMDLHQAERLARAAVAAGAGFQAQLLVALAVSFLSRGDEAEVEVRRLVGLAQTDLERATASWGHAGNLFWIQRRPVEAEKVLGEAEVTVCEEDARRLLAAMRAAFHAFLARPDLAVPGATHALAWPTLPAHAIPVASFALVAGFGVQGRVDELGPAAAWGYAAASQSFDVAFLRFPLAQLHIVGLRLAGYAHEAERVAREHLEASSGIPGAPPLYGAALAGQAALAAGRLHTAVRWLREAHAGLSAFESMGHDYVCLLNLTQALAMSGEASSARRALADTEANRHPAFVFLDPELSLARAWVAAAEGAVSHAITLTHEAVHLAASRGQPAHEVLALHTAVCFGDRTVADWLAALATQVQGPRAPAAAAHAAALAAGDGAALLATSMNLEEMGDLLGAADAAAQAAAAYTRHGQRAATAAAARAHNLAAACEGARTPALVAAARPLPLTDREREIVTLAAQGLSNREIADRLTVSVRTVEGHLYRAGAKLNVSDRTELAALLGSRQPTM